MNQDMEKSEKLAKNVTGEIGGAAANTEPNYSGIKAMPFILGNETFEKLGTLGTSSNLSVYLSTVFHMSTLSANNVINIFNGTCSLGTLVGAFLCDTYFGRYKTIAFASVASFLGMFMLTITAAISALHPPSCDKLSECEGPTAVQMTVLISGFGLMIIGASGIRPCNLAFGADQFNPNTESGKRGINSFFNWYYFTYTFAVMISATFIVYVQSNISWSIGFAIPTTLMLLSCALFFAGTWIYVKVSPQGSSMISLAQVIVAAFRKRRLNLPEQTYLLFNSVPANSINSRLPRTENFRFLDKAATLTPEDKINPDGSAAKKWNLCSVQQVEEVKCILRVTPIWIAGVVFQIAVVNQLNYIPFQAFQSNRHPFRGIHFQIPAATYNVFSMLALTIFLPIYDRIIIPFLRRYTKKEDGITPLQRMGIGIILAILSMSVSAIVESRRRTLAFAHPTIGIQEGQGSISSMSASWFIPQLALMGLAEGFTFIAQNELFYKEFPESLRSIAASLVLCGTAVASYFTSFLAEMVHKATRGTRDWLAQDLNEARLDYFFYLVAIIEVLNIVYFLVCAKWYRYKGTADAKLEVAMEKLEPEEPLV